MPHRIYMSVFILPISDLLIHHLAGDKLLVIEPDQHTTGAVCRSLYASVDTILTGPGPT